MLCLHTWELCGGTETRDKKKTNTVLVGKAEGKSPLAVQCIFGRIILKWI